MSNFKPKYIGYGTWRSSMAILASPLLWLSPSPVTPSALEVVFSDIHSFETVIFVHGSKSLSLSPFCVMKRSLILLLSATIAINAQTTPSKTPVPKPSGGGDVGSLLLPLMAKGIPFGPAPKGCSDFEVLVGEWSADVTSLGFFEGYNKSNDQMADEFVY